MHASDWCYKGEGASNVVLDYHGTNQSLLGKVLRIRKERSAAGEESLLSEREKSLWMDWPSVASASSEEELMHAYVRDVIRPLLGEEYVDPGMVVPVSKDFLLEIAEAIKDRRPLARRKAADLDFTCVNALLVPDLTKLATDNASTLAIEIKPKCGYLPISHAIACENDVKTRVPRFTMHQHLKYAKGKVKSLSSYSPLDLFSGSKERILRAIEALFTTPQNNLRVFLDGAKVFTGSVDGSDDSTSDRNCRDAFSKQIRDFVGSSSESAELETLQKLIAEVLHSSDVLPRLLHAQKEDCFDIEGMIHVYYSYMQSKCIECETLSFAKGEIFTGENKAVLFSGEHYPENKNGLIGGDHHENERTATIAWFHSLPSEVQKQFLCKFLTSTTAKDCSLMVALTPAANDTGGLKDIVTCPTTKRRYLYKLSFLDLDLKRLEKLPFYHLLDQSIVRFYLGRNKPRTSEDLPLFLEG